MLSVVWGANTSWWKTLRQSSNCTALWSTQFLALHGWKISNNVVNTCTCCAVQRTWCNSEQSASKAPQLKHRKPLQGSTPTCRNTQERKSSCTLPTGFDALLPVGNSWLASQLFWGRLVQLETVSDVAVGRKALSGGVGAHLSHVQSNCFVLFNDLARAWQQQTKRHI